MGGGRGPKAQAVVLTAEDRCRLQRIEAATTAAQRDPLRAHIAAAGRRLCRPSGSPASWGSAPTRCGSGGAGSPPPTPRAVSPSSGTISSSIAARAGRTSPRPRRALPLPLHADHASWVNQIECWFSLLARRVLHHGSSGSAAALRAAVAAFMTRWNAHERRTFRWTFTGYPMQTGLAA